MSEEMGKRYNLREVLALTGVDRDVVVVFVERRWIRPAGEDEFDQEDVARIALIEELRRDLGANDESIPIILHLMDQLYCLRRGMQAGRK